MNHRKLTWLLVALLAFVLGVALLWSRRTSVPRLPALAAYPQLPAAFAERLAAAHRAALASSVDPAAVRALAHLYQANRLETEARACYAWLATRDGGLTAEDHRLLADLALNAGDLPRGIAELRAAMAAAPDYIPARVVLAEALFKSGQPAAAEYEAILARVPDQPQALLGLARVALQQGDDAAAIARLEQLLAAHRDATAGAGLLAQVMKRRGEAERAAALVEWSRQKRDPVPADPWLDALWPDCYDAQRLTLRVEELVNSGQLEDARALLARVEQLDPASWLPHLLKAWTLDRDRHPAEAVGEYRAALQKSGDAERILALLVPCLLGLNRAGEAMDAVQAALRTQPDSVALLTLQSDLVVRAGGDARPLLEALLQKEPYLYKPNMDLAKILWAAGDKAAAVVCLTRVAKAFPVDVASRGLLGQYYLENHDPAAALPPLEQALPQAEAGSAARARLAAMLESALVELAGRAAQAKQFKPAADALARLAALQPENPTVQISLGDMLYQAGDPAAARMHWQQALALAAPADTVLRGALTRRLDGPITPDLFE